MRDCLITEGVFGVCSRMREEKLLSEEEKQNYEEETRIGKNLPGAMEGDRCVSMRRERL